MRINLRGAWDRKRVHTVTDARTRMSDDIDYRKRRYLISMGIRTGCLVLAVVLHGPPRFAALVAAILLPYFAVVFANGGREPESGHFEPYEPESTEHKQISGPSTSNFTPNST